MLSRKILIQNIENLTDARYFAAWGVDYMSFSFAQNENLAAHIERYNQIVEWIEGPATLAEFVTDDFLFIQSVINEIKIDGLILPSEKPLSQLPVKLQKYLMKQSRIVEYKLDNPLTFYDANELSIQQISALPTDIGLILSGGDEEKVGFKSFDDIADIFEYLEAE